jgi:hypothetical protein
MEKFPTCVSERKNYFMGRKKNDKINLLLSEGRPFCMKNVHVNREGIILGFWKFDGKVLPFGKKEKTFLLLLYNF